jgi:protein-S-isoprenylcysteine O-methyltransferase Ste14
MDGRSLLWRSLLVLRVLIVASAFVGLWSWLAVEVRRYDSRLAFTLPAALRPAGLALAAAGGLLVVWCVGLFAFRGGGTPAPFDPPREFVASGPYRAVRNPMYLGAAAVLLGAGLAVGSPSVALLAPAFLLLAHLFVRLYEEPALTRRFGDGYRCYKAKVRRWLPAPPHRG